MKTSNNKKSGFTLVEIIISASIAMAIFGTAYGFLARGFFAGEKNLKSLSAVQEMSLIIYSLRLDLKAFHEKEGDESTYLAFDAGDKKLSFSVVKNIKPDGEKEYCRIAYRLSDGGALTKTMEWTEKNAPQKSGMQLAGNNGIREFAVKIFDASGAEINGRRNGPYKKPVFLELKIAHRSSERLEAGVVLRSLYPDDSPLAASRFWMTGFKTDSGAVKVPGTAGIIGTNTGPGAQQPLQKPLEISESAPDGSEKGEITTAANLMGLSNEINSAAPPAGVNENAGKNAQGVRVIEVNTPEYRANYSYVKDLYKTILERDLDQDDNDFFISGVPYWVARLYDGHSKDEVKNCIMASEERFVLTCFKKYCKRAPTNLENKIFTSRLQGGESRTADNGAPAGGGLNLAGSKDGDKKRTDLINAADGKPAAGSNNDSVLPGGETSGSVLPGGGASGSDANTPAAGGGASRSDIEKEIARMGAESKK